jgi:hypothetical protein
LNEDYLDVDLLIRSLQRAEGNPDCFRRVPGGCEEIDCCWRPYCLEEPQGAIGSGSPDRGENGPGTAGLPQGAGERSGAGDE